MKWTEIFTEESWPIGPPLPPGFTPQALRHYEQACKNPVSGFRGFATFHEAAKRERRGDTWTGKLKSSTAPLKKPNFSSFWHGPLSRWLPFEHSGTKMGSLDIDPVYSTLCPSITSTRTTANFHSNTFQYSVSGLVMLNTFSYSKDCTGNTQCFAWKMSLG